jgi:hypothetical protein
LVVSADFLFFRQEPGINRFVFCLLLVASIVQVARRVRSARMVRFVLLALLCLLPMIEAATLSSWIIAAFAMTLLALAAAGLMPRLPTAIPPVLARFLPAIPLRSIRGTGRLMSAGTIPATARGIGTELRFWLLPLVLGAIFVGLFAGANPLIERALQAIDLAALLSYINIQRIFLWLVMGVMVWVLLRPKLARRCCRNHLDANIRVGRPSFISEPVVLRALLLFNLLFVIQSVLDAAYLWGGLDLPEGMSHAEYAHRGAYPLVVTALLAALFVLVAIGRGESGAHGRLIRGLVYIWIGQNILLCVSAILRLDLYVEAFSLTGMRVAAGLWMLLVAVGLALIMMRILFDKSNLWLFATNGASLLVVLYGVAVTDIPALIASYNVQHSSDLDGGGEWLDDFYLRSLGPAALPAIDLYLERASFHHIPEFKLVRMRELRSDLLFDFQFRPRDWRSWTWRVQRLENYLARSRTAD